MMTMGQLVSEIGRHQPAELALLLGAGASKSSGVSLASEMIDEWRQELFEAADIPDDARAAVTATEWLKSNKEKYPWFEGDTRPFVIVCVARVTRINGELTCTCWPEARSKKVTVGCARLLPE